MPLFCPCYRFHRVENITPEFLTAHGIKGILLDVDNTLSPHNAPDPEPPVMAWLKSLADNGIEAVIVSNNSHERVKPFAGKLGLRFISRGLKPLPTGFNRAQKMMGLSRKELAVVGDQLFTDMTGGNLAGIVTLLVDPIEPEDGPFFKLKRRLEKPLLKHFDRKHGKQEG
jgi:HAD superfamily phosphatase (TIGR01668 family)